MIEPKELGLSDEELKKISAEVLEHSNNPRNYGVMNDPDAISRATNDFNNEAVIVYLKLSNETVEDITFVSNGCKDMVVSASLFTEMIKGDSVQNAKNVSGTMLKQIENAPDTQKDAASLVLLAFEGCFKYLENKENGIEEEMYTIVINEGMKK